MVTEVFHDDSIRGSPKFSQVNSLRQVLYSVMQPKVSPNTDSNINKLFLKCPELYRDEQKTISNSLVSARWRKEIDRKVLAPLAVKENTDNFLDVNVVLHRKRKLMVDDDDLCFNNKRAKLRSSSRSPALDYMKNINTQPVAVVKLFDVFQEIPIKQKKEKPVAKNDYMSFLGLDHGNSVKETFVPEWKISHPIKLSNITNAPFSSDYGRRLLSKRPALPEEILLKKIERVERYLKEVPPIKDDFSDLNLISTYSSKKAVHYHNYSFPKRQYYEKLGSWTQNFYIKICRPLSVKVERSDLNSLLKKTKDSLISNHDLLKINCEEDEKTNLLKVDCAIYHKNVFEYNFDSNNINVIPPLTEILSNCSNVLAEKDISNTNSNYVCKPDETVKKKSIHRRSLRLNAIVVEA